VKYIKQGSNNPTSLWARASLEWIMQLTFRFGLIDFHGPFLTQYVCITEMVEDIVIKSARMFKGTMHEADWMFYHDALSLMMAKDTIKWMKEEGHYER
jgi:hypothetical protein